MAGPFGLSISNNPYKYRNYLKYGKKAYGFISGSYRPQYGSSTTRTKKRMSYRQYKKTGYKPRYRKKPYTATSSRLQKQLTSLQKKVANNEGHLIYKNRQSDRNVSTAINECNYLNVSAFDRTLIETVIANLRYFNPAVPATFTTVDFTSGTQYKSLQIKAYSKITLRNNYQVPVKVSLYLVIPRKDTSIASKTSIENGLTDIGLTNGQLDPLVYPSDSPHFNDLWKIVKKKQIILQPSQQCYMNNSKVPWFSYDPSYSDSHSLTYQSRWFAHQYLIRVEGVIGHDSAVATEYGVLQAGVDAMTDTIVQVRYSAGADIKYMITADDSAAAFTNGPQITVLQNEQANFGL